MKSGVCPAAFPLAKHKKEITKVKNMTREGFGLVQAYTGGGKGKTSAALGLALRAVGQGFKVYMIQFMKSGDTGELFSVKKYLPNITIVQVGKEAFKEKQAGKKRAGMVGPTRLFS